MNKIAAGWLRVSSPGQADPSLGDQLSTIKAKANELGYELPPERVLSVVWASQELSNCPPFQKLQEWVYAQQVEVIFTLHRDRLTELPEAHVFFVKLCEDKGVTIIPCEGPPIVNGDEGRLMSYIEAFVKRKQVLRTQFGARFGLHKRVTDRRLPVRRHPVFGYDWDGYAGLVPNKDWHNRKLILDLLLRKQKSTYKGSDNEGITYRGLIKELACRAIPSPTGNPNWSMSSLTSIIHSPINVGCYYGLVRQAVEPTNRAPYSNRKYGKTSHRILPLDEGVYLPEVKIIDPIITWDEREQILSQAKQRQKFSKRNAKQEYMLRGLIHCDTHIGKHGEPLKYTGCRYNNSYGYRCQVGGCVKPKLHGLKIESWIKRETKALLSMAQDENFLETMAGTDKIKATEDSVRHELKQLESKRDRITNAETDLEQRSLLKEIDGEVYQRLKARFRDQRQWITDRCNEIQGQLLQLSRQAEAEDVIEEIFQKFWYKLDTMSVAEWRDLLTLLNVEVHVKPISSCPDVAKGFNTITPDWSRVSNIWRYIEKNRFSFHYIDGIPQWTIEPGDAVIEVRFGVPLGNLEPQKVRDCVLPTLVGRTGLEPVTP